MTFFYSNQTLKTQQKRLSYFCFWQNLIFLKKCYLNYHHLPLNNTHIKIAEILENFLIIAYFFCVLHIYTSQTNQFFTNNYQNNFNVIFHLLSLHFVTTFQAELCTVGQLISAIRANQLQFSATFHTEFTFRCFLSAARANHFMLCKLFNFTSAL